MRLTDVDALVRATAEERIVASSRDGNLRLALHLSNTEDDIDTMLAAFERRRSLLA